MQMNDYFAWTANILVCVYKLPQIWKLYKDRDINGFSVLSYGIQTVSYSLYISHGFLNQDYAIAHGMIIPLVENLIVILLYFYIKKSTT